MPVRIIKINENVATKMIGENCAICGNPLNAKPDMLMAIKKSGKVKHAHPDCAVSKNWVSKSEIQKEYLVHNMQLS